MLRALLISLLVLPAFASAVSIQEHSFPISVRPCFGTFALGSFEQKVLEIRHSRMSFEVFYTHGFADHKESNSGLFEALYRRGGRVIAPELPFHGDSRGSWYQRLAAFKTIDFFDELARQDTTVASRLAENEANRPLVRMGWSTGGLLALYEVIRYGAADALGRPVSRMVLHAPGVAVRPFVGRAGFVTRETLFDDEVGGGGRPYPISPFARPFFATQLLRTARYVRNSDYPIHLPTLVVLGSEEGDRYVKTRETREWFEKQIGRGARIWVIETPYRHGVGFIPSVQNLSADFAAAGAGGNGEMLGAREPGVYRLEELVPAD